MSNEEDERLKRALWEQNTELALKLLSEKQRWDDTEITSNTRGRPLRYAVHFKLFEVADAMIAKGADPNFTYIGYYDFIIDTMEIYPDEDKEIKMLYLVRKGARVTPLAARHQFVQDYIYRQWSPCNHLTWPDPFRAQVRAILSLLRGPRRTMLHSDTLLYLFAWLATSYFQ